jgi:hypothetical protein
MAPKRNTKIRKHIRKYLQPLEMSETVLGISFKDILVAFGNVVPFETIFALNWCGLKLYDLLPCQYIYIYKCHFLFKGSPAGQLSIYHDMIPTNVCVITAELAYKLQVFTWLNVDFCLHRCWGGAWSVSFIFHLP